MDPERIKNLEHFLWGGIPETIVCSETSRRRNRPTKTLRVCTRIEVEYGEAEFPKSSIRFRVVSGDESRMFESWTEAIDFFSTL